MQTDVIDQLNQFAGMMMHVNMMFNKLFMQKHGISFAHFNSLLFINQAGCTKIQCLADHLGVTKTAVSQMVDRLVEAGLVLRNEDPSDRRSKLICLSPSGKELLRDIFRVRLQWVPELAEGLTETQQVEASQIFETLNENLTRILERVNFEMTRNHLC